MSTPGSPFTLDDVRRIVREEIAAALGMLAREAQSLDGYDTDTIQSYAYGCITEAAGGAAVRLTCPHETYRSPGGLWTQADPTCSRCGEPEPELKNPFEEESNDQG